MIAIFTVLGLVLLGGGAYAIFDGWPYLVLERGFTQVIIGSIASTAGLILLSLAWVLKEFRAVRRSLLEDAEARAAASLATATAAATFETARPSPLSPVLVPVAVGAAAAGAVAEALSVSSADEAAAAPQPAPDADRDLFGDLVRRLREPEPADEKPAETPVPETPSLSDMFKGVSAERHDDHGEPPIAVATESHEPAEVVAAKVQSVGEDEALAHSDDLAHPHDVAHPDHQHDAGDLSRADEEEQADEAVPEPEVPEVHEEVAAEPAPAPREERTHPALSDDLDEFSALRASLTGHLQQTSHDDKRIEPSLEPEADPFAAAEAWMDRATPRKEPWFEATPPANEPQPAETGSPPWPPRTEAPALAEPAAPAAAEPHEAPAAEEPALPDVEEAAPPAAIEDEAKQPAEPQEEPAAASEPAASEEGIVGAYQVGDAHFTIYADGSIRARTPDGEYSFSSMDELKVYLASEKSRLGV